MSKLTYYNLEKLIPSMKSLDIDKEHFSFTYAKHRIDCIFAFTNEKYELLVGIHTINYGFVVQIEKNKNGKYIAEINEDIYRSFCNALHLSYQNDSFSTNTLLNLLSKNIPTTSAGIKIPYETMRNYIKCRPVDESEKIYFKGWNDHIKDGNTAHNFDKTEFYFGKKVADYCRKNNISSLWTRINNEKVNYHDPSGFMNI